MCHRFQRVDLALNATGWLFMASIQQLTRRILPKIILRQIIRNA